MKPRINRRNSTRFGFAKTVRLLAAFLGVSIAVSSHSAKLLPHMNKVLAALLERTNGGSRRGFVQTEAMMLKNYILAAAFIYLTCFVWSLQFSTHASNETILSARELSLDERTTYQQHVENVYWQDQIWGKENPKLKPSLEEVILAAVIRARAEDAVRRPLALEKIWQHPVRGKICTKKANRRVARFGERGDPNYQPSGGKS